MAPAYTVYGAFMHTPGLDTNYFKVARAEI